MNYNKTLKCISVFLITVLLAGCTAQDTEKISASVGKENAAFAENSVICYLGPEGTYTEEAAKLFFGADSNFQPQQTVSDSVKQLLEGKCDYAVIPQENTIGGPVYDYIDEVIANEEISIVGEVELPIRQALLVREGTALDDIETVYSHKQGIAQGADWLKNNLSHAEVVEVSSTAEGARIVSESDTGSCAAIASVGSAKVYGLTVLAENIQNNDNNKTRFYVLSGGAPYETAADRIVFTAKGEAGDLPELIIALDRQGLTPVFIHDRTEKTILGRYIWLIECEGGDYSSFTAIKNSVKLELQYRGAFSVK
ncbi:MAG: prephenate dehydratase [Ruminiclostridium sp.]